MPIPVCLDLAQEVSIRIVSLCPSITKLVFDLEAGSMLVGVTRFCVHPAEGASSLQKVGGTKDPHLQTILELQPDLVLMNREENRREDAEFLRAQGLNCHFSHPQTLPSVVDFVEELGALLDRQHQACGVAENIRKAWDQARQNSSRRRALTWAYLIWRKPWMTVNGSTYIHHLLVEAGGSNVFADLPDPYPAISTHQLAVQQPETVMLSSEPFPFKDKHIEELSLATGLPSTRFRLVDGELISWHGALTAEGLRYADRLFASVR